MEGNNRLANDLHGTDGPSQVSDHCHIDDVSRWFVQSVQALGEPFNPDLNASNQRGVGFYQFTIHNGKRNSAPNVFNSPQSKSPRLTVRLGAEVDRITIEISRAIGVAYRDKQGDHITHAVGEIILAAGALITPKLLILSGIGPADISPNMASTCRSTWQAWAKT